MAYKNTLKGYLKFEETNEERNWFLKKFDIQGRYYHLSHSLKDKDDPQAMDIKEIKEYIEDNYVNADFVNKHELINDLNIFKSLCEVLQIKDKKDGFLMNFISLLITIISIASAVAVGFLSVNKDVVKLKFCNANKFYMINMDFVINNIKILLGAAAFYIILYFLRVSKRSGLNKLKTINHVIFTLEAIKENLVEVPVTRFEVVVDNLIGEISEPRKYSVNVSEILEDKINEGTIEGKNKSIEIKINL